MADIVQDCYEAVWRLRPEVGDEEQFVAYRPTGALMAYLAEHRIPLDACPTSNVRTRQVSSIAAHPVRRMLDQIAQLAKNAVNASFLNPASKPTLLSEIDSVATAIPGV